jgi:hypothetical protein
VGNHGDDMGFSAGNPGAWLTSGGRVPDKGSTLSLMTLTLSALGLAARRLQRGSGLTAPFRQLPFVFVPI